MKVIKAEEVIIGVWDQVFGLNGLISGAYESNLGVWFEVEIGVRNFGFELDGNTLHEEWARDFLAVLEVVVTGRHEVFIRRHSMPIAVSKDAGEWVNTSNHESCWRSDGLRTIWEVLLEGYEHCYAHVPEEHRKSMATMSHDCSVNTGLFSKGVIQLVRVKSEPRQDGKYGRVMTDLTRVGFSLTVE